MTSVLLVLVALTGVARQASAQTSTTAVVTGVVSSARTGAPLADVVVTVTPENGSDRQARTGRTDPFGRVVIADVPPGRAMLTVSTIGYIFVRRRLEVPPEGIIDLLIPLAEGTGTYEESVEVAAGPPPTPVGQVRELSSGALQELRGVATDDPVRAVQALPGVATGDDFQAEFSVRGSAYRQVGLVLDSVATPLLFHSVRGTQDTGSIAMINTDVISRAALHIGPHAPKHGNWLGATLEFDIREGSRDRLAIRGAISGTNASTVIEGPLTRGRRGSWLLSVRKSYVDWLVRKIDSQFDSAIGFLDAQAKLVYDVTPRQQVQVLLLGGDATYTKASAESANELARATSSSGLVSAAWRLATARVLVSQRLSLVSNRFRNRGRTQQEQARGDSDSLTWRADATLPLGGWTLETGADATRDHVVTTLRNFTATNTGLRVRAERLTDTRRTTTGAFVGLGGRAAGVALGTGVRVSHDTLTGTTAASPWVMAERDIKGTRLTASASRVVQYPTIDQASATAADRLVPERAWLFDAGIRRPLSTSIGLATTVFRRGETDIIRRESEHRLVNGLRRAESLFPLLSSNLDGTSRGVDVTLERRADRGLTGWLGYTWSRTRYEDRITGERFDGDFDQRHTFNLFLQQRLSNRLRVSARFRYGSNFPIVGYFEGSADALRLASTRNQVRLPAYARLDLSASRTFTYERSRLTLFVEVMNATNRDNYGPADGFVRSTLAAENFSERLLPIVPSAGILLEF